MGKREEQSFADHIPDSTCEPAPAVHLLLRQAPRSKVERGSNGTGKVIPMNRKKGRSTVDGDGKTGALSVADRRRMTEQIGRQLRGMYDGLLSQPVPDRFAELMKQLEENGRETENEQ